MAHGLETNLALFIDFDNVAIGSRDARQRFDMQIVLQRLLEKGKIIVKRAYADWGHHKEYLTDLHQAGIELIEIPAPQLSGKNSADIRLVVDAMDLCYGKEHLDTFVIVSGDSDFTPLVSKLRENGKAVIGVGMRNSSSHLLIVNCDEFIFYDDLYHETVTQKVESLQQLPSEKRKLFDFLVQTIQGLMRETRGVLYGSLIKDTMKRKQPEFNERNYGYSNFGDLLEDAMEQGLLDAERDSRAGGTWVVRNLGKGLQRVSGVRGAAARGAAEGRGTARRGRNGRGRRAGGAGAEASEGGASVAERAAVSSAAAPGAEPPAATPAASSNAGSQPRHGAIEVPATDTAASRDAGASSATDQLGVRPLPPEGAPSRRSRGRRGRGRHKEAGAREGDQPGEGVAPGERAEQPESALPAMGARAQAAAEGGSAPAEGSTAEPAGAAAGAEAPPKPARRSRHGAGQRRGKAAKSASAEAQSEAAGKAAPDATAPGAKSGKARKKTARRPSRSRTKKAGGNAGGSGPEGPASTSGGSSGPPRSI